MQTPTASLCPHPFSNIVLRELQAGHGQSWLIHKQTTLFPISKMVPDVLQGSKPLLTSLAGYWLPAPISPPQITPRLRRCSSPGEGHFPIPLDTGHQSALCWPSSVVIVPSRKCQRILLPSALMCLSQREIYQVWSGWLSCPCISPFAFTTPPILSTLFLPHLSTTQTQQHQLSLGCAREPACSPGWVEITKRSFLGKRSWENSEGGMRIGTALSEGKP